MVNRRRRGELGERIAEAFLAVKGYQIIDRNVRVARREIDILARDGGTLVAVEVKLRRTDRYGSAAQGVDARKLGRIRMALQGVLGRTGDKYAARIDVVAIDFSPDMSGMIVDHIEGVY